MKDTVEHARLSEERAQGIPWKKWGPYLAERQWGTVREDYSKDGDAWNYFTHDQARSRAYRWGEDGLAGISDHQQHLCFAPAFWNGTDPILKERLFGLTNAEGNHGEDVKEYYFYLDNTPTHAYMKYLYKYPQQLFPYEDLVHSNRYRSRYELEYELIDTGVFKDDRYFDIFIEYAKVNPECLLISITAHNRGPAAATLDILPTLWFRDTWSQAGGPMPRLEGQATAGLPSSILAYKAAFGEYSLRCENAVPLLFTDNQTNVSRLYGGKNQGYVKDGINDYVVQGAHDTVNPGLTGTKAAAHYHLTIPSKSHETVRLIFQRTAEDEFDFSRFDSMVAARRGEADDFYTSITPPSVTADAANVLRQALAGMLWTKQYYYFDVDEWLAEHGSQPESGNDRGLRNAEWFHMINSDVISMPDKWEYPWYAAWDLAFHTIPLGMVDLDFAKSQLELVLRNTYLHPSGQLPAYEWNFGDVNPPVHAFATLALNEIEKEERGKPDYVFLKQTFHRLLLNFTWWANRRDPNGHNLFDGGFLGLDNIGVFDRSRPLPTGGALEQADGTAWMVLFCQNMLALSLEIANDDPSFAEMALKFLEHFLWIASAMHRAGDNKDSLWDEQDGFFYDLLRLPNGKTQRLKLRSMVGLLPLCATTVAERSAIEQFPDLLNRARAFVRRRPELSANIAPLDKPGFNGRVLLSILNETKLRRVLRRMLDENEFLSPYGIRSLSKEYLAHPYILDMPAGRYTVEYMPAESSTAMFGGNANWRGPIWLPVNLLILRALHQFYLYYGDDFRVECPTGSGQMMTLYEVAQDIARRLYGTFLRGADGRRPVFGDERKFQEDPHWDFPLFYEYFHGDNGAGIGASHQTGWTGIVARLIQLDACLTPEIVLESPSAISAMHRVLAAG